MRTIKGRRVCATLYDLRGTAHLLDPGPGLAYVCGRPVTEAGPRTGRNCRGCAEGALEANRRLRATPGLPPEGKVLAWLARILGA